MVVVAGGIIAAVLLTGGDDGKKDNGAGTGSAGLSGQASGFPSSSDDGSGTVGIPGSAGSVANSGGGSAPSAITSPAAGGATGVYYTVDLVVSDYFDDLNDKYYEGLTELTCQGYSTKLTTTDVNEVTSATDSGPAKVSGGTATGAGRVVLTDGTSRTLTITMTQQPDEKWCVSGETSMR